MRSAPWEESDSNLVLEFHAEVARRQVSSPARSPLSRWMQELWQWLVAKPEPRIWQQCDRHGNLLWRVYDPESRESACFTSEAEVRVWLEQRYNH